MAFSGVTESQEEYVAQPGASMEGEEENGVTPAGMVPGNAVAEAGEVVERTVENVSETATSTELSATANAPRTDNVDVEGVENDESVVINLKFLHRERVTLQCVPSILIADLKQRVRDAYIQAIQADATDESPADIATQPVRLIYKGKVLKDDHALSSYGFLNNDTIHAVFSRAPPTTPPAQSADLPSAATATATATDADEQDEEEADTERGAGVTYTRYEMPLGADLTQYISAVVGSTMAALGDNSPTPMFIFSPSTAPMASSTASSTSQATAPPQSATAAPSAATARPAAIPPPVAVPVTRSGSSLLLNEAAALRRSIPALELAPLMRPPELSIEMYDLGNAMREAGDTYLAIHRQLQFIATGFLQENHLSVGERVRLRSRVQQLVSVLGRLSGMSTSVSRQLASSPYGMSSSATSAGTPATTSPPTPAGTNAAAPAANGVHSVSDFLTQLFQTASESQHATQDPAATAVSQVLGALPNILSAVSALTGGTTAASFNISTEVDQSTAHADIPVAQVQPLRSLALKIQARLADRLNHLPLLFDDCVRDITPVFVEHITACCVDGVDQFVQKAIDEVEDGLRFVEVAISDVPADVESRRRVIRFAFEELVRICTTATNDEDARVSKIRSWLRRSVSHLCIEQCEIQTTDVAVTVTVAAATHLASGISTSRTGSEPTVFKTLVSEATHRFLESRFSIAS